MHDMQFVVRGGSRVAIGIVVLWLFGCDSAPAAAPGPVEAPLRRLTVTQYDNSIRDLLRIRSFDELGILPPGRSLPVDGSAGPFASNARSPVGLLHVDQYLLLADTVAAAAVERVLPRVLACEGPQDEACVRAFVSSFGLRAFRRPIRDDEHAALMAIYQDAAADGGLPEGVRAVLATILSAPSFIYVVEHGTDDGTGRLELNDFELATRLSLLLWNTTPDDDLLLAALSGSLSTEEGLLAQFGRLLADRRGEQQFADFHLGWLGMSGRLETLDKSSLRYPLFSDPDRVRESLARSFGAYVNHVIRNTDARYSTLMSVPLSFMGDPEESDPLFQIYGVREPAGHSFDQPVGLNPTERRGILTHPAFLAVHARSVLPHPIGRGLTVIRNVLCLDIPPPPVDVDTTPPEPDPTGMLTRRQQMEQIHQAVPSCGGCHRLFDPLGFTFENYGALGEYRTYDNDDRAPVDATAEVDFSGLTALYTESGYRVLGMNTSIVGAELDGPVENALQLVDRIAVSETAHDCYALQWYRFAFGRSIAESDEPAVRELQDEFLASGGDIRVLLRELVTSEAFRSRAQ